MRPQGDTETGDTTVADPSSSLKRRKRIGVFDALSAFFVVGLFCVSTIGAWWTAYAHLQTKDWVATSAQAEAFDMTKTGRVRCLCSYVVEGRTYRVIANSLGGIPHADDDWYDKIFARLAKACDEHEPLVCYVNPANPKDAVINRDIDARGIATLTMCSAWLGAMFALSVPLWRLRASQDRRNEELQTKHPREPWMWMEEWVQKKIMRRTYPLCALTWIAAAVFNLGCLPAYLCATNVGMQGQRDRIWPLPIFGAAWVACAVYDSLKARKFGRSYLEIDTLPGTIGGSFRGTLVVIGSVASINQIQLTMLCKTKHREGRESSARTLWKTSQTIQPDTPAYGQDQLRVPFEIDIPSDCLPCDDSNPKAIVYWQLRAKAAIPGINLDTTFRVPIFRRPEGSAATPLAEPAAGTDSEEDVFTEGRRNRAPAVPE